MNYISKQPSEFDPRSSQIASDTNKAADDSPTTVTEGSFHGSNDTASEISIKKVSTNPITRSILKSQSAYHQSGKIPTAKKNRSLYFAENSRANDGEEQPTKPPQIKVVHHSKREIQPSRKSPSQYGSSTPSTTPEEISHVDAAIEKAFTDAGNSIVSGLKKAAIAAASFFKAPEDFFIPDRKIISAKDPQSFQTKTIPTSKQPLS